MASSVSSLLTGLGTNTGVSSTGGTGAAASNTSTGLGQGINVGTFVQSAEIFQQAAITSLQNQQSAIGTQATALSNITSDLSALQTAVSVLNDPLGVLGNQIATSSNTNVLNATASSSAIPGAHSIAVTSLATTSSYYSDAVATGATALATGDTLAISAGGTPVASVTVGATNNTLNQIAAVINSQATSYQSDAVATGSTLLATSGTISVIAGGTQVASVTLNGANNTLAQVATAINSQTTAVQASVVTDANGAHLSIVNTASTAPVAIAVNANLTRTDTSAINFTQKVALNASVITDANGARLALVSGSSGAPGSLALTGTLHRADTTAINFTQAVPGANAVLSVDGVPISSATNTVNNVIPGVTLTLASPTTLSGPVSLTVAPDTTSINTAITTFVSAYNTAVTAVNAQFHVNSDGSGVQPLEGDGSLRDAQQQLLSAATFSTTGTGGPVNLTTLGISTNSDGTLNVDSGGLATALSTNFSGVQSFLQSASTSFTANFTTVLNNLNGPATGELSLDAQGMSQTSSDLGTRVANLQAALAVQTKNLNAIYAQVNVTLQELPLLQQQLNQQLSTVA